MFFLSGNRKEKQSWYPALLALNMFARIYADVPGMSYGDVSLLPHFSKLAFLCVV